MCGTCCTRCKRALPSEALLSLVMLATEWHNAAPCSVSLGPFGCRPVARKPRPERPARRENDGKHADGAASAWLVVTVDIGAVLTAADKGYCAVLGEQGGSLARCAMACGRRLRCEVRGRQGMWAPATRHVCRRIATGMACVLVSAVWRNCTPCSVCERAPECRKVARGHGAQRPGCRNDFGKSLW